VRVRRNSDSVNRNNVWATFFPDGPHHRLEEFIPFRLVLDQRVFLSVGAQPNRFAQISPSSTNGRSIYRQRRAAAPSSRNHAFVSGPVWQKSMALSSPPICSRKLARISSAKMPHAGCTRSGLGPATGLRPACHPPPCPPNLARTRTLGETAVSGLRDSIHLDRHLRGILGEGNLTNDALEHVEQLLGYVAVLEHVTAYLVR